MVLPSKYRGALDRLAVDLWFWRRVRVVALVGLVARVRHRLLLAILGVMVGAILGTILGSV